MAWGRGADSATGRELEHEHSWMWILSPYSHGWQAGAGSWFLSYWAPPRECLDFLTSWCGFQEQVSQKIEGQVEAIAPYDLGLGRHSIVSAIFCQSKQTQSLVQVPGVSM